MCCELTSSTLLAVLGILSAVRISGHNTGTSSRIKVTDEVGDFKHAGGHGRLPFPGQQLYDKMGVSTAVWKAVNDLKEEGLYN